MICYNEDVAANMSALLMLLLDPSVDTKDCRLATGTIVVAATLGT
jgi:hypothetical protein